MTTKKILSLTNSFKVPLIVLGGLILYLLLRTTSNTTVALFIALATIGLGSFSLFKEAFEDIMANQFALDYIAILAITVSLVTHEYLVGAVIALMLSTGRTLEEYGANQAKRSLSLLADRIPHDVLVETSSSPVLTPVSQVKINSIINVRKGEVIPLDGTLLSESAFVDESSLTGEPYAVEKIAQDLVRSGTVNTGNLMRIKVTREEKNSTYSKIISMVERAEREKAPMVRLADKYSVVFTIITFIIAIFAYIIHPSLESVLAVLVVATPCPLILATPIALLGGVNAAAKKRIIVKKLASLEALSRANTVIFDKTGTITLGKPEVTEFTVKGKEERRKLLAIAEAIERNSLHPLAKAVVNFAKTQKAPIFVASSVQEFVGKGISGVVNKKTYTLSKLPSEHADMRIGMFEGKKQLGEFVFADKLKDTSKDIITSLKEMGLTLSIFTGDKKSAAEHVVAQLGVSVDIRAELKPEDKQKGIAEMKKLGKVTAMVGDGINDAPALALADVGMVFSNEEQTAASEAADVVFLGGDFSLVLSAIKAAKRTISIAKESIFWGIGLSIGAMIFASLGFIPPIYGAMLQEAIDVAVIVNALRASR
ncbi:MAG TPA: heavy metal translocating P-type ATPase [Patescibacteria group bacterium]